MLAHLRFPVAASGGRRYPEPDHPYRNPFQRDRDRIVHARAFRRLEAKTQVFTAALSDHFRNRLTHTIEVAQIARTAAGVLELDQDLTEALALAHDIGHPPFAHAGEQELDRQMARFGEHFDHNLHALRIVESFEQRYARFPGLNLTFEVREGMVKHSRDIAPGEHPELEQYLPGLRPPLEAQLIDLADEVAYNTADLDDAWSAGLFFTMEEIAAAVPRYAEILEAVETQFPGASERERFHEALRRLIDGLVTGLVEGTVERARAAGVRGPDDVRALPRLVAFTPAAREADAGLKDFLYRKVYSSPELAKERRRSTAMIAELFEFFLEHPDRLPAPYDELAAAQPAYRVICDYIAGMTDGFCRRTWEKEVRSQKSKAKSQK